jgi:hypothetical protein
MRAVLLAALACLVATGCGGGGSGGGGGGSAVAPPQSPPPPPSPPPLSPPPLSATIALSTTRGASTAPEDDSSRAATFWAAVTTTATAPLVIDATYDPALFSSVVVTPSASAGVYLIAATTRSDVPVGARTGSVLLRACQEAACTNVYAGSGATYTHTLTVTIGEWVTYQRNAAHTGYVPVTLDPSKFAKAWEIARIPDLNREGGMIAVNGSVYFTAGTRLYSVSEASGVQNWMYEPADAGSAFGAPGYHGGRVYVPYWPTGSRQVGAGGIAVIRGVDAVSGSPATSSEFLTQNAPFASPTFQGASMYYQKGEYGSLTYRYALPSGSTTWEAGTRFTSGYNAVQTPAVDDTQVYYFVVNGITIVDKATGTLLPESPPFGGSTVGEQMSPIITARGHVVGRNMFDQSRMQAIDRATRKVAWTSRIGYPYQPVTAGNVIYAYHEDNAATIDAISDTDGSVLWSWPVPPGESGSYTPSIGPNENMVLTDNLLFLSTLKNIYAIDLITRQTVWTYPVRGQLVLTNNRTLLIFERTFLQDSRVIAIKLN